MVNATSLHTLRVHSGPADLHRTSAACVSEFKRTRTYPSVYAVRMCAFINRDEQICCRLLPASSESMNDGGRNSQQGHSGVFVCLLHS